MMRSCIAVIAVLFLSIPAFAQVSVPISVGEYTGQWFFDHDGYGAPKWGGGGDYTASLIPGHTYSVGIPWAHIGRFKLNDNGDGTYTFEDVSGGGLIYSNGANPSIQFDNRPVNINTAGSPWRYSGDWAYGERSGDSSNIMVPVGNGYVFGFGRFAWGNQLTYNVNEDGTVSINNVQIGTKHYFVPDENGGGNWVTETADASSLNLFSASGNTINFHPITLRVKSFTDRPSDFHWWSIDNSWGGNIWSDTSVYIKGMPGNFPMLGHLEHPSAADPAVKEAYVQYLDFSLTHPGQVAQPQVTSFATGATKTWEFQWMVPGDANGDAECNFADYLVLESNFGNPGGWEQADFNLDGAVDFADYLILEANYGAVGSIVPEPMTLSLLGLGALALIRRRR